MKFGYVLPGGSARFASEAARIAEEAGWDGFFVWEPVWGVDAWISLTAAAMVTQRIRLGTMISPLSRMRPWKIASETATLDQLSDGRVILSVGLGAVETGFAEFGEVTDRRTRAELLDESLDILTGLWKGQPFSYEGKHYHIRPVKFSVPPPPVQQPGIPIWVVGLWPNARSMRRAVKYDGILPAVKNEAGEFVEVTPQHVSEIRAHLLEQDPLKPDFDIIVEGQTPGENPVAESARVRAFAEAGATWWIEANWDLTEKMASEDSMAAVLARCRQGPPQV